MAWLVRTMLIATMVAALGCDQAKPSAPAVPATPANAEVKNPVAAVETQSPLRLVGIWEAPLAEPSATDADDNFGKAVLSSVKTRIRFAADGSLEMAIVGSDSAKTGIWKLDRTDGETDYVQFRMPADAEDIEVFRLKFADDDHFELLPKKGQAGEGLKYTRTETK